MSFLKQLTCKHPASKGVIVMSRKGPNDYYGIVCQDCGKVTCGPYTEATEEGRLLAARFRKALNKEIASNDLTWKERGIAQGR